MHAEQTPRGIFSVVIKAKQKKECRTAVERLKKDARDDSLRLQSVEYLEKEMNMKLGTIKSQPPCHLRGPSGIAPQQHASEGNTLEKIDGAIWRCI